MTPTVAPTTCTGSAGTWPQLAPSPSATETRVPGTEAGPSIQIMKVEEIAASKCPDQWSSSSTTPRSSSHCPTRSSVASTSHASPPRGPTPSCRCRPSVLGSAQIKLSGKTGKKKKRKKEAAARAPYHWILNAYYGLCCHYLLTSFQKWGLYGQILPLHFPS